MRGDSVLAILVPRAPSFAPLLRDSRSVQLASVLQPLVTRPAMRLIAIASVLEIQVDQITITRRVLDEPMWILLPCLVVPVLDGRQGMCAR